MSVIKRLLTIALGLFLISAGAAKFTGGHAFQYIEFKSGVGLFYPFINHLAAVAEIVAGGFLLYRPTRLFGGLVAATVMTGAVAFHLSPWLGVTPPTGFVDGASAPWDATDFVDSTSPAMFLMAITTAAAALAIVRSELRLRNAVPPATVADGHSSAVNGDVAAGAVPVVG